MNVLIMATCCIHLFLLFFHWQLMNDFSNRFISLHYFVSEQMFRRKTARKPALNIYAVFLLQRDKRKKECFRLNEAFFYISRRYTALYVSVCVCVRARMNKCTNTFLLLKAKLYISIVQAIQRLVATC